METVFICIGYWHLSRITMFFSCRNGKASQGFDSAFYLEVNFNHVSEWKKQASEMENLNYLSRSLHGTVSFANDSRRLLLTVAVDWHVSCLRYSLTTHSLMCVQRGRTLFSEWSNTQLTSQSVRTTKVCLELLFNCHWSSFPVGDGEDVRLKSAQSTTMIIFYRRSLSISLFRAWNRYTWSDKTAAFLVKSFRDTCRPNLADALRAKCSSLCRTDSLRLSNRNSRYSNEYRTFCGNFWKWHRKPLLYLVIWLVG